MPSMTLSASVVDTYFQILSLNERIRLARQIAEDARHVLALIQVQQGAGTATELQVQQQIETPLFEHAAQPQQFAGHCMFLEGDKLDAWEDRRHQPGFEFADDPGEPGRRPPLLKRAQCGRRVAGVANGR